MFAKALSLFLAFQTVSATEYIVETFPINDSDVFGIVVLSTPTIGFLGVVTYQGFAEGLEADLVSMYGPGGTDCSAKNGCGTHVHSGSGCEDAAAQGGHWYNATNDIPGFDPWTIAGYKTTSEDGEADFVGSIFSGYDEDVDAELEGRAFVIHNNAGARVSCGIIEKVAPTPDYYGYYSSKSSSKSAKKKGKSVKKGTKKGKGAKYDSGSSSDDVPAQSPSDDAPPLMSDGD